MPTARKLFTAHVFVCILAGACGGIWVFPDGHRASAASAAPRPAPASAEEKKVWDLEHDYWRYVEANDLTSYRSLWHENFLGWPRMNATPATKEHITDWITSKTSQGLTFKLVEFKPAALHVTGDNLVVVCYWVTSQWVDKTGAGAPDTARIIHTWIKNGNNWQIIGGMSSTEDK